jgi:hypothetical protein
MVSRVQLTVHDRRQPLVADAHPRARPPDVDRPPGRGRQGWRQVRSRR